MLTDTKIKNAKAEGKSRKLFDAAGLFLMLMPGKDGETHKRWRFKFTYGGKEKLLALGTYPAVSLVEARKRRNAARALLDDKIDPTAERKSEKQQAKFRLANTFSALADDWFETKQGGWSGRYAVDTRKLLERELLPELGNRALADITPRELLALLRKIERRDAPAIAEKVLNIAGQILRHGVLTGPLESDPSRDLRGALKSREVKHHARLTEAEMPEFLAKLAGYTGAPVTSLAMRLLLLTVVRTQELRFAQWPEIDTEARVWRIPKERMKSRHEHIVPLSHQAVAAFEDLHQRTENRPYAFPNEHHPSSKPMSENAVLFGLYRLGYHSRLTGHGFRSMFSTIAHESGLFDSRAIELQLAHSDKDKIRAIYNAALYLKERTKLMQWWADRLDELLAKKRTKVISIEAARR